MNKKSMFFSLSALLFVISLLIIFNNDARLKEEEDKFDLGRAQIMVMDNFVRDFDHYYIQQILESAAKSALVEKSATLSEFQKISDITGYMENLLPKEKTTDNYFKQALGTLSFQIPDSDANFSYRIIDISQPDFNTIKIDFAVDYSFEIFETKWEKSNKEVTVILSANGITHPEHKLVIDHGWIEDSFPCSPITCLLSDIIAEFDDCNGVVDIIDEARNCLPNP
jgi:hypothetical protein